MKLKALYIGINRSYVNPTTDHILNSIAELTDLYRFGPGYVTQEVLEKGLKFWVEQIGSFDFLITDSMIVESKKLVKNPYLFENDSIYFEKKLYYKYVESLKDYFFNSKTNKLFIANWDYYCVSDDQLSQLLKDPLLFVISNVDKNSSYSVEKINSIGNKMIKNILLEYPNRNDVWHNFITNFDHKIISMPNIISRTSFVYTPIAKRKYRYCVPGYPYKERITARKLYNFTELVFHFKMEFLFFIEKISRKLFIPRPDGWGKFQNERLFKRVSNSKICFTSGAVTRTPIAKYFEIPASGSLLICQRFSGFENFGFRDQINCFVTEDISDIKKILNSYDEDKYQKIADRGRRLVWELHSDHARTRQLKACLEKINAGSFAGSFWENGIYVVN